MEKKKYMSYVLLWSKYMHIYLTLALKNVSLVNRFFDVKLYIDRYIAQVCKSNLHTMPLTLIIESFNQTQITHKERVAHSIIPHIQQS